MATLNTVLNNPFAAQEAARLAQLNARAPDGVIEQVKNIIPQAGQRLQPGTTIIARFQYKVGQDGSLFPTQTDLTTETNSAELSPIKRDGQRRPGNFLRQFASEQRQQTLADIAKPRPQLSPSDEIRLFAAASDNLRNPLAAATDIGVAQTVASATLFGQAVDEQGTAVNVEILPPQGAANNEITTPQGTRVLSLAARAQASVASLYARNNDVVYNAEPLSQLAA